jgi:hypothetical protein
VPSQRGRIHGGNLDLCWKHHFFSNFGLQLGRSPYIGKLSRMMAQFGAMHFEGTLDDEALVTFMRKKATLQEEIEQQKKAVTALKSARKETLHHIDIKDLPEDQKFKQLSTQSKHLIDTIKMTAYRAETAMANSLRSSMSHPDKVRTLLSDLYQTEAYLLPDLEKQTLTVRLHHLANVMSDKVIEKLCTERNGNPVSPDKFDHDFQSRVILNQRGLGV